MLDGALREIGSDTLLLLWWLALPREDDGSLNCWWVGAKASASIEDEHNDNDNKGKGQEHHPPGRTVPHFEAQSADAAALFATAADTEVPFVSILSMLWRHLLLQ